MKGNKKGLTYVRPIYCMPSLATTHSNISGGSNGDRTRHLVVANDALFQMSYGPMRINILYVFTLFFNDGCV